MKLDNQPKTALERLHNLRRAEVFDRFSAALRKEGASAFYTTDEEQREAWSEFVDRIFHSVYDHHDMFLQTRDTSPADRKHAFQAAQFPIFQDLQLAGYTKEQAQQLLAGVSAIAMTEIGRVKPREDQRLKLHRAQQRDAKGVLRDHGGQPTREVGPHAREVFELISGAQEKAKAVVEHEKKYAGLLSAVAEVCEEFWMEHKTSRELRDSCELNFNRVTVDDALCSANETLFEDYMEIPLLYSRTEKSKPKLDTDYFLYTHGLEEATINQVLLRVLQDEMETALIATMEEVDPKGIRRGPDFIEEAQAEFQHRIEPFAEKLRLIAELEMRDDQSVAEFDDNWATLLASGQAGFDHYLEQQRGRSR